MSVSHSVVGNDPSEPDTFILQGQREVHERKHKEGNTPNFQHERNIGQTALHTRWTQQT